MANLTNPDVIGHTVSEDRRAAAPIDPGASSSAALLGYTYRPGDLVVDQVTGQIGTVLHARVATVLR